MAKNLERERLSNEAAQALGRHYVDWIEPINELERSGDYAEAERILLACVDATEREAVIRQWGVAPWYYESLAIIYRKQKRYGDEVEILERYLVHDKPKKPSSGKNHQKLADRLVKASELWAEQRGTLLRNKK